jgi:single-strand DNA-binding protein
VANDLVLLGGRGEGEGGGEGGSRFQRSAASSSGGGMDQRSQHSEETASQAEITDEDIPF